jgi:hypothetical protein
MLVLFIGTGYRIVEMRRAVCRLEPTVVVS